MAKKSVEKKKRVVITIEGQRITLGGKGDPRREWRKIKLGPRQAEQIKFRYSKARGDYYVPAKYYPPSAQKKLNKYEKMACSVGAYAAASRGLTTPKEACGDALVKPSTIGKGDNKRMRAYHLLGLWRAAIRGDESALAKFVSNPASLAFVYEDMGDHVDWGLVDPATEELIEHGRATTMVRAIRSAHMAAKRRFGISGYKERRAKSSGESGDHRSLLSKISKMI